MSSIPLVALSVRPPEIQDPVANQGRLMQLRALGQQTEQQAALAPGQQQLQQQQIQGGQMQLEQEKRGVADQQALTKAMQEWDGKDYTQIPALVIKNGGSANAVFSATQNILGQKAKAAETAQNVAKAGLEETDAKIKQNDEYRGRLQNIISAPADQKQALWDAEVTKEEQAGTIQPGQMSHTYPGDPEATALANHFALASQLHKEAKDAQETQIQEQARKQAEANAAETARHNRAMEGIQSGAAGGPISDEATDQAAERYSTTGQLPPMGRGAAGLAQTRKIINRAAELHPGQNLTANSAEYKANQQSLQKIQTNFDQVTAFENTAGKNLDQFLSTAKKVVDSGSPWITKPLRTIDQKALGDADLAAFNAARVTALTEIAKVLNSSNASGVLSDSARSEVSQLIGPDATLKQIVSAANILKTDMANRHQSYQQQIGDIQKRLGGAQGGGGQTSQSGAPSATTRIRASDGSLHDIPTANLDKAKQIDPKLQVIQ